MVSGFEHINPINDNSILVGAQEGFYHIDYEKYRKRDVPVQSLIYKEYYSAGKS